MGLNIFDRIPLTGSEKSKSQHLQCSLGDPSSVALKGYSHWSYYAIVDFRSFLPWRRLWCCSWWILVNLGHSWLRLGLSKNLGSDVTSSHLLAHIRLSKISITVLTWPLTLWLSLFAQKRPHLTPYTLVKIDWLRTILLFHVRYGPYSRKFGFSPSWRFSKVLFVRIHG